MTGLLCKINDLTTSVEDPHISESIFNIYSANDFVYIQTLSAEWEGKSGSVDLIDISGRIVRKIDSAQFWKNSPIQIPSSALRGIYIVKIQSGVKRCVGKVMIK